MDLPIDQSGNVNQAGLSNDYFQNIDSILRQQEKQKTNQILGEQADRGFLSSGDTFSRVANEVTNPGMQARASAFMPELSRSAGYARDERLGEQDFQRKRQFADEEFQRRLQELTARSASEQELTRLESALNSGGGFDIGGFFGNILGSAGGAYVGSRMGGGGSPSPSSSGGSGYIDFNPYQGGPYAPGSSPGPIDFQATAPYNGPYGR